MGITTSVFNPIPGFPGYRAGADGTVWSCWRQRGVGGESNRSEWYQSEEWATLKPDIRPSDGRKRYSLKRVDGKLIRRYGSYFVLLAFVGPRPDGMEACHGDGDCTNDSADNLRWDTHSSNMYDRKRHGESNCDATPGRITPKRCPRCAEVKMPEDFYNCRAAHDGKSSWCKRCMSERKLTADYREKHNKWAKGDAVRSSVRRGQRKYAADPINRMKIRARWAVKAAIRSGRLVRPDKCESCGLAPPNASDGRSMLRADHHNGYARSHWLDVRFICSVCDGESERSRGNRRSS